MNGGADVFTALGWGLRKYAWVVVLLTVLVGVLVLFLLSRGTDNYQAQAQVSPLETLKLPNLDPLPRLGDSVFNNGAIADAIRTDQKLPRSSSVIPSQVELIAAQDNLIFTVIGHNADPQTAQHLANLAASTFTAELNKLDKPVGKFFILRQADLPAVPTATLAGGRIAIAVGLIAGAIAGVGIVALLLVIRRPVLDASGASEATGAPVLGRIRLPVGRGTTGDGEVAGIAPLCRGLLASPSRQVLLASPPQGADQLRQLGVAMSAFLGEIRRVRTGSDDAAGPSAEIMSASEYALDTGPSASGSANQPALISADGSWHDQIVSLPDMALTVLVVPEGIALRSLRESAAEYFTGGPAGIVFVGSPGRFARMRSRKSRSLA